MLNKIFGVFVGLILSASIAYGQNWNELFSQKKTQRKYLIQQIAALQIYSGYLKKGYELVHSGLGQISDASGGEMRLHQTFIHSLSSVSPLVHADPRAAEVILMQHRIIQAFVTLTKHTLLKVEDLEYISQVRKKLDEENAADLQDLLLVMTPGKVKMKDDGRLQRLNRIHERMEDKLIFARHFSSQVLELARQRHLEQINTQHQKLLFNLKTQP